MLRSFLLGVPVNVMGGLEEEEEEKRREEKRREEKD
jgi:hypothetical protein